MHLADDGDRRRVDELGDVGADEGRADEHAPRLVDDEARRAGRAAAVEAAAGGAGGLRSTARTSMPASRADASVCPTAATCGSVKTTRGESGAVGALVEPARRGRGSRRRRSAPGTCPCA